MYSKLLLILLFLCCTSCAVEIEKDPSSQFTSIIPKPSFQEFTKESFSFTKETLLNVDASFRENEVYLKKMLAEGTDFSLKSDKEATSNAIIIKKKPLVNNEAYELIITAKSIKINTATNQGVFYAIQSLRQLFPVCFENNSCHQNTFTIRGQIINDTPTFTYRGMHLDVGRHFFTPSEIKKYIDMLAMLKMNTFHWHLTEDQGWRIEIKKYPLLTEVGAFRKETLMGHYNDQPHQFDGKQYGGYYTQEEIKDIVAYALERQITIIPEIEMPGHSQAAIAAYPELGCSGEKVEVATKWGIFDEIYCPHEKTFAFLEDVLDEVMQLFPSKYIHIGGDEAPKAQWKNCDRCQKLIKKEGLKDEHGLQSYFITKIESYLNSKGRQIIGWDEILEGGLAPNATVMSWRGTKGAIEAAKQGHQVIMTPNSHCYFDHYQSNNEDEPLAIGGFLPLEKVYAFNPIPKELNGDAKNYVLGAQGNVWTEYIQDFNQVTYMAFPRAIALSEVVWSGSKEKDYLNFITRLAHFQKRMDAMDMRYANHLYDIEGTMQYEGKNTTYSLATLLPQKTIRYTTDGSEVTSSSLIYKTPIPVNENILIKAGVFEKTEQLGSIYSEGITYHKATGKKVSLNVLPNEAYNAGGKKALVNGINGSDKRYGDKEWLGFFGDDIKIAIDLEKRIPIYAIVTRFFNAPGQWIYAPEDIEVFLYNDDSKDSLLMRKKMHKGIDDLIVGASTTFTNVSAGYIEIVVKNYGIIPEGKQGEGNPAWTFIDEIIIE